MSATTDLRTTNELRRVARAATRQSEIEIRSLEQPGVPFLHTRCGRFFASLDEALHHDECAPALDVDERALVDGFLTADCHDRTQEREQSRSMLIDVSRHLTNVRDAVDMAFKALSEAFSRLDAFENRQRDSNETFKRRRASLLDAAQQATADTRKGGEN